MSSKEEEEKGKRKQAWNLADKMDQFRGEVSRERREGGVGEWGSEGGGGGKWVSGRRGEEVSSGRDVRVWM